MHAYGFRAIARALASASFRHFGRRRVARRPVGVRLQLEVLGQAPDDGDLAASA
jgi:hypothetical protein